MTASVRTLPVSALRIVPVDGERADLRQLINQGPVSRSPGSAAGGACVRGPSAITIALPIADPAPAETREPEPQVVCPPPSVDENVDAAAEPPAAVRSEPESRRGLLATTAVLATVLFAMAAWVALAPAPAVSTGVLGAGLATQLRAVVPAPIVQHALPSARKPAPPQPTAQQPLPVPATAEEADLIVLLEDEALAEDTNPGRAVRRRDKARETTRLLDDAGVALAIGDRQTAVSTFESVLERRPHSAVAAAGLSAAHFDNGRFDLAADYARQAVKAEFGNADYHVMLGDAYYRLGKGDDAHVQWSTALKQGSDRAGRRLSKDLAQL